VSARGGTGAWASNAWVRGCVAGVALSTLALAVVVCRRAVEPGPTPVTDTPEIVELDAASAAASGGLGASPLISRRRPVRSHSPLRYARAENINDGDMDSIWAAGRPSPEAPAWIAIDVGVGPQQVLVSWSAAGSFNYEETDYGSPGAYRIETSADSSDGLDGRWELSVAVAAVVTRAQAHRLAFAGKRWVRLVVTGVPSVSPNGVQLDELEVRDVSAGCDSWFFMGDSITATAFGRAGAKVPGFSELVYRRHPPRRPAVLNGGIGGETSEDGVRHIDVWLARSPDVAIWGVAYGTNDAAGNAVDTVRFAANLRMIVERIAAARRRPILATIPFASDDQHRGIPLFNEVIEEVRRTHGLVAGPDLYAWFAAHPEELSDGVHPNERGVASIQRLWAEAAEGVYSD
jgi:acyl-CoA thioesterase-1